MFVRRTGLGRAAGGSLAEEIGAEAIQTGRIGEARKSETEGLLTSRTAQGDFTVFGYGHGGGAGRYRLKTAEHRQAITGDNLAGGVDFE